ncbi:MAG: UDP-3-O-acyl-N-acetylglucosamine deacetylase [Candidatus Melainabacteria bacterium]|nr:UDP-3-O-acyl-N-acetylglucosamine deacetylase [Candidatus Melainabacteria bacterium]
MPALDMPTPAASVAVTETTVTVSGHGLITGLPVAVRLEPATPGSGICFHLANGAPIPARLSSVVQTDRGVTLGTDALRSGQVAPTDPNVLAQHSLSIVEHFLAACALSNRTDLNVFLSGEAPELPILDGSAGPWLQALQALAPSSPAFVAADLRVEKPLFIRLDELTAIYALPAESFQVTYTLDYPHPLTHCQWTRWHAETDSAEALASAGTFGMLDELPVLQARGLARGVNLENSLGLMEDGQTTRPLRMAEEPLRHKVLDLLGDLSLLGINPLRLQAHIFAINAGHTAHIALAKQLSSKLSVIAPSR